MQNQELQQAIMEMLQSELSAMHYYQHASRFIKDSGASYHFNLLAQEELEHARTFYGVYPGDDLPDFEELVKDSAHREAKLSSLDPKLLGRLNERAALQLAIKMEEEVANSLHVMLENVRNPAARVAIEENIESTLSHLQLIKEDFQRMFEPKNS